MLMARRSDFGRLSRELAEAEDSIAVLVPKIAQLTEQTDSLGTVAHKADTVLVHVTKVAAIDQEAAQERYARSADSLRATLDSAQAVHLANIETSHRAEVRAVQRLADERLRWGTAWRDYAVATDSLAKAQAAQLAMHSLVNAGLRSALVRERQQVWLSRSATVIAVAAVVLLQ